MPWVKAPTSPISSACGDQCFPWLRPICQVDFLGQAPASPIWSAFSGRRFPLLRPICQVDFLSQTPTNPTWFSGHCFSFAAPNLPGRLPGSKTKSSVWFAFNGERLSVAAPNVPDRFPESNPDKSYVVCF